MNLLSIIDSIEIIRLTGKLPVAATGITQDSRFVRQGFVFVALTGQTSRGLDYVSDAEKAGACLLVTDDTATIRTGLPVLHVRDMRKALTAFAHGIYDDPSRRLKLVGVTGTDGKTSTVRILRSIIEASGERCGTIGTIGYFTGKKAYDAPLTTPDIDRICSLLHEMIADEATWAVMEVSSHALSLGRVNGLHYSAAGYTNLSSEHRDFHVTMEDYADAKSGLFRMLPEDGYAVINRSDPWCEVMIKASAGRVITYGKPGSDADLIVSPVDISLNGSRFLISFRENQFEVFTKLTGIYQGENIALASGIALMNGITSSQIIQGVADLEVIPGRMEPVNAGQKFSVLVDYSHTDHALKNALTALRNLCDQRIITVFGCGGNRDKTKRPKMGQVVSELSDIAIVTSDNPRFEEPDSIIMDIMTGIKSKDSSTLIIEPNREAAIETALRMARPGDVVLIAGKGAETYQEIKGVRHPFDDRVIARNFLSN